MLASETERMHYLLGVLLGACSTQVGLEDITAYATDLVEKWEWKAPKYVYDKVNGEVRHVLG